MRKFLIFEAAPERPTGGVLLQLSVALRQLNLNPERLVWESPMDGALQFRLSLGTGEDHRLRALADHLRQVPGVNSVRCEIIAESPASGAGAQE